MCEPEENAATEYADEYTTDFIDPVLIDSILHKEANPYNENADTNFVGKILPDEFLEIWVAFERTAERERVVVALNFANAPRQVRLDLANADLVISTDVGREGVYARSIHLSPNEGVVLRA